MSKLYNGKEFRFMEHCNWTVYTPFLGEYVIPSDNVLYNIIHNQDNVVHLGDNVILIF